MPPDLTRPEIPDASATLRELRSQAEAEEAEPVPDVGVVHVRYRLGDGRVLDGGFAYRLPTTVNDEMSISVVAARMRGNLPPDVIDMRGATVAHMVATLTVAVTETPEWARDTKRGVVAWNTLPIVVVERIYAEVQRHADQFRSAGADLGPAAEA